MFPRMRRGTSVKSGTLTAYKSQLYKLLLRRLQAQRKMRMLDNLVKYFSRQGKKK